MTTKSVSITIIFLAIVIALGIVFGNDKIFKQKTTPVTVVSTKQDVESSGQEEPLVQKIQNNTDGEGSDEIDRRREIQSEYFQNGELVKPIDTKLLLTFQRNAGDSRGDSLTGLATNKLFGISESEYLTVVDKSIPILEDLNPKPSNVTREGRCTNIKLDNLGYESFCDHKPNEYGMEYKYYGYSKEHNFHLLAYFIEESATFIIDQEDGRELRTTHSNLRYSSDKKVLVAYSNEFGGGYSQGGISVLEFDPEFKYKYRPFGGYYGGERWGIDGIKIDAQNAIYFKTVTFGNQKDSDGNLTKTYSYFKQIIK